jgi:stage V sporulation protein K
VAHAGERTGTFFVQGIEGQAQETTDDRLIKLKKWFDLNPDGTAKHMDVQPKMEEFGFQELPTRSKTYWAKDRPNNSMANILTWAMMEMSKARFEKYKELGIDTSLALMQAAKSTGLPVDYQPKPDDSGDPLIASFLSLKRRSTQLKTLERESLRQALGVRRSVGEKDSTLINDEEGSTYDADIVADVIKRSIPTGVKNQDSLFPWEDMNEPIDFPDPNRSLFGGAPARPDGPQAGPPGGGGGGGGGAAPLPPFPAWMLTDPPRVPDRDLTPTEIEQINRLDEKKRQQLYLDKLENDRNAEIYRKRQLEIEQRRLDALEASTKKDIELKERRDYRDEMAVELDIHRLEQEKKKLDAQNRQEDEGPLPTWDPYLSAKKVFAVLEDIEKNYSGNDQLKDFIYMDIVSFLGDPVATMNDYRNYAFMGPSGVGKTTWARLMGKIYKEIGMYLYGIVAETKAQDYISNYLGQTSSKTAATLNQNLENIILIDEAYSMARGGNKDYGSDAITAIVDWMDKNLGCYMLIIAGYEKDINDDFLAVNEGLDRRFNNKVVFLEYTGAQMADILKKILSKSGSDKKWDNDTWTRVAALIEKANASKDRWGKFYEILFSKQAGSITLIAAKAKKYMLLPTKRPPAGQLYTYERDMMQVLLSFLPMATQKQISDKRSEVYEFLLGGGANDQAGLAEYQSDDDL